MRLQFVRLLLLAMAASLSCSEAWPRLLSRCPVEFQSVVEPLPAAVGDSVLLVGAGVRLWTVDYVQDSTLRVEADRLVLNESVQADAGPYSGPHVLLCTDALQPLVTFSLFLRLVPKAPATTQDPTMQKSPSPDGAKFIQQPADAAASLKVALVSVVAILSLICAALGLSLCFLIHCDQAAKRPTVVKQPIFRPSISKGSYSILEKPMMQQV